MTVNTATSTATYTGNGVTTAFVVPFYFLVNTDLQVLQKVAATGVVKTLALNSDYTLTGAGVGAGGSLTMTVAPATGDALYIARNVIAVQQTSYPANSPFPAASHEMALDRLTMLAQQLQTGQNFALYRNPLSPIYDLQGNTLVNEAVAVNPADVPNLTQVQTLVAGAASGLLPADIQTKSGLALPAGSAGVGFLQAGTGVVARTTQSKARDAFSVKDFGAVGNGASVAADSAALLAALASIQLSNNARGCTLHFPTGQYNFNVEAAFTAYAAGLVHNIWLSGDGPQNTLLDFSAAPGGSNGISFNAGAHFGVSDLTISGAPAAGLLVGKGNAVGGAAYCQNFIIRNVRIQSCGAGGFQSINAYLGSLLGVWSKANTGIGFAFLGFHTSISAAVCESSSNTGVGWSANGLVYSHFDTCGSDSNGAQGWALSNVRGVALTACGSENNQKEGFLLFTSTASATGTPNQTQDVHGVVFNGCYANANSLAGAGTYATFIGATTLNGRPIDFKVTGGSAIPATVSDFAFQLAGASGAISQNYENFDASNFVAADSLSGTYSRRNLSVIGLRATVNLSAVQPLTTGVLTTVAWSTAFVNNDLNATIASNAIVIPAGVNKVRISTSIDFAGNVTGVRQMFMLRNGAAGAGLPSSTTNATSAGATVICGSSGSIAVAAGDTLSIQAFQNSGASVNIAAGGDTWLSVEAIC